MFQLTRKIAGIAVVVGMAPLGALAQSASDEVVLSRALSAGPPQLRADATVMAPDGRILQRGSNGYTCMLDGPPDARASAMCLDEVFMPWAESWSRGDRNYSGPTGVGLAYMLSGDAAQGGASNTDPFATDRTPTNQWVVEGPHVMVIAPDETAFNHLPTDPNTGGPYVMWKGTPYAHVMMPVGPRDNRNVQASMSLPQTQIEQLSEAPVGYPFRDPRLEP
ncbi:MAG: hypothetical protein WCZ23_01590 [Rhodospirillaceae bacterium]